MTSAAAEGAEGKWNPSWAEPGSLLGRLQRGRGEGYRGAIASAETSKQLVLDCIIHDPRLDHQAEDRGWFYAGLVADLGIDLEELRAAWAEPLDPHGDDAAWLAVDILELSARRGIPGAIAELRRYLRSGRDPELALTALLPVLPAQSQADGLLSDILEFAAPKHFQYALHAVDDFSVAPWPDWRRANRDVDWAVNSILTWRAEKQASLAGRDPARQVEADRRRLVRVGSEAPPGSPLRALARLDVADSDRILEVVPAALATTGPAPTGWTASARRLIRRLRSPEALEWARRTASLDGEPGWTALTLLCRFAEPGDRSSLRGFLEAVIAHTDAHVYTQCELVPALGRLGDMMSLPLIETLYATTLYSLLRHRCATALSGLSDTFPTSLAVECLWDCEANTRLLAIRTAATHVDGARQRIGEILNDSTEDEECRQAANAQAAR